MFAPAVAFVDLETTGADPLRDRVTEVGIVKVVDGRLDYEWSSLVNPGCPIPPAIERFVGISDAMVADAPSFAELADEIADRLAGCLFVAHNARFDNGFLRAEFARLERSFQPQVLCTVKLSRALYPGHYRHGLDAVMARHGIACTALHRALGDARVLWEFARIIHREHSPEAIAAAMTRAARPLRLPDGVNAEMIDNLPESAGVFELWGTQDAALYVGSGANVRSAVLSHLASRGARYAAAVTRVETQPASGLAAELLASRQVAALRPLHNRGQARGDAVVLVGEPPGGVAALSIQACDELEAARQARVYGPFASRREALRRLRGLAEAHGLCFARCAIEGAVGVCSSRRNGRCRGACEGAEPVLAHDARLMAALARYALPQWPFDGPVALRDDAVGREHARLMVFDRWRWLGTADDEAGLAALLAAPQPRYDEDICRILRRFLARPDCARRLQRLAPGSADAD